MITGEQKKEYLYLLELLSSVLNGHRAENRLDQVEGGRLYQAAVFHGVEAMAFDALRAYMEPESDLYKKWARAYEDNLVIELYQMAEYEEITHRFSDAGICFMPLKGILMKQLYGSSRHRKMGDLDLLIEPGKEDCCRELMAGMGYETVEFGQSNHDSYSKGCVRVELHSALFSRLSKWYAPYFEGMMERASPSPSNAFLLLPDRTDFYLFNIVHFAKHFYGKGSGLRSLVDVFVMLRTDGRQMTEEGQMLLKSMGLEGFEARMSRLGDICFSQERKELSEEEKEILDTLICAGTYGSPERRPWNQVRLIQDRVKEDPGAGESESSARRRYFLSRVFLRREAMEARYPILKRYPGLLPVFWLVRGFKVVLYKREKLKQDWELLMK